MTLRNTDSRNTDTGVELIHTKFLIFYTCLNTCQHEISDCSFWREGPKSFVIAEINIPSGYALSYAHGRVYFTWLTGFYIMQRGAVITHNPS